MLAEGSDIRSKWECKSELQRLKNRVKGREGRNVEGRKQWVKIGSVRIREERIRE